MPNFSPSSSTAFFETIPACCGIVVVMSGANGSFRTTVPLYLSLTLTSFKAAQSPEYADSSFGFVRPAMRSNENFTSSAVTSP